MINIGIDPDCDKSGFALIHGEHKELCTLTFFEILKRFKQLIDHYGKDKIIVYIECGFLNKSN